MNLSITKQSFNFDKRHFFVILCMYYFLNTYIISDVVITKELYYQSYGEQVAFEQIDAYVEASEKWSWIGYVFLPLVLLIKISFVALCLNIGTLLNGINIGFKKLFQIVMIAHVVFACASFIKGIWLLFFIDVHTLQDIQLMYPLSLLSIVDTKEIEAWLIYPLQTINLFEFAYWLAIAKGLQMVLNQSFSKMLTLVVSTYGIGLITWMVIVVFLSLNLS
ncbi:MAG: hypothetical protein JKY33_06455 [Bacteroidia bacterium]|nr:hypothetical protein [Bacteroidia bacterium]